MSSGNGHPGIDRWVTNQRDLLISLPVAGLKLGLPAECLVAVPIRVQGLQQEDTRPSLLT